MNFAVYQNKDYSNSEYMKDSKGNVYKFIFGVNDIETPYNYLKKVGTVKPMVLPNDFDSNVYNGYSPIKGNIYHIKENYYWWEC